MRLHRKKQGFTLIEILIVIVIIAILAAVGLPIYQGNIKRAMLSAAMQDLGSMKRSADVNRSMRTDSYDDIVVTANVLTYYMTPTNQDFVTYANPNFDFSRTVGANQTLVLTAAAKASGYTTADTVMIDQAGAFTCGGKFKESANSTTCY